MTAVRGWLATAAEWITGPLPRRRRWLLLAVVATGLVLRLAWLAHAKGEPPVDWSLSGDQYSYWYYGNELASGRGYESYITGEPTAYYPIGYPAILAATFWTAMRLGVGDLMLAAGLLHVVLSTLTIVLVFVVARHLFGHVTGLVAAGVTALFPNLIYQVASLQLETTFIFLSLAALAVAVSHDWSSGSPSAGRLVAFGAVLGTSVLVRPFSVWFVVGLALAVLLAGEGWRPAVRSAALPLAVVLLMMVPWTIRNAIRMDAFIPSSTNMGDTLCIDRGPGGDGGFRWASHEGCVEPTLPEVERNRGNTKRALETVIDDPVQELRQIVKRAGHMFRHDHDGIEAVETLGGGPSMGPRERAVLERIADGWFFGVLAVAAAGLAGVLADRRLRRRPDVVVVIVAMASLLAVPLLLWGNPRFHLPLLPLFAVLAAHALVRSGSRLRHSAAGAGPGDGAGAGAVRPPARVG